MVWYSMYTLNMWNHTKGGGKTRESSTGRVVLVFIQGEFILNVATVHT